MIAHRNCRVSRSHSDRPLIEVFLLVGPRNQWRVWACLLALFSLLVSLSQPASAEGREDATECLELAYAEKITCLEEILEENPGNGEAFFTLTWAMAERDEWEQLMAVLKSLRDVAPDRPHFYQMRAQILVEHFGDQAAADLELRKAEGLQRCLLTKAEEVLKPLPPTRENSAEILERATTKYISLQDYAGAAEDFETYLALVDRPKGPYVYRQLAGARRQLGDLPGAIDALSLQIEAFPETTISTLPTRARLYRELGDEVGSKHDLAELERLTLEHNRQAIARLDDGIASRPESVWLYLERGRLNMKVGELGGAIADANRAMELEPGFAEAYELRAKAKTELGDLDGARADRVHSFKLLRDSRKRQEDKVN